MLVEFKAFSAKPGGGGVVQKFLVGRLCPKVQPYHLDRKGTPFITFHLGSYFPIPFTEKRYSFSCTFFCVAF